jgi:hypothetical protein
MEFVYILVGDRCEWEDIVIFASEEDAIAGSVKYPMDRVEVFSKKVGESGYTPIYSYYQNGK